MKMYLLAGILLFLTYISYEIILFVSPPLVPKINENIWWAPEDTFKEDVSVRDFTINISNKVINDLKWRLQNHRLLVPSIEGSANQYGTNSVFLTEIIKFWSVSYNWTEREEYLNKYPQFMTNIQGLDIHFIHVKPKEINNKKILPILLVHGWPGSVREFYDVIGILTTNNALNNDKTFILEVIVPSIPGFGFSQSASKPGLGAAQVAVIMKTLMNRLGHQKFFVQGGDMGAIVLQILCVLYPKSILGFHTNFPLVYTVRGYLIPILGLVFPALVVKQEHYNRVYPLSERALFIFRESGYIHLQATKPDSLGAAINESPVALAAYFLEKFITGSNFTWITNFKSQDFKNKFPYTNILDNLMYYWITKTATTAFRLYYETFGNAFWSDSFTLLRIPLQVPTIIFRSKYDLYMTNGVLGEIYPNLLHISDYDTGHFPAFENPELFSKDLLNAIGKFVDYNFGEE